MTERALWVAKTGLDAQQTRMAVISNNLANVNTTGFKKARPIFEDLMYQNIRHENKALIAPDIQQWSHHQVGHLQNPD